MLYDAYEVQRSFLAGASRLAGMSSGWLNNPANPFAYASMSPLIAAGLDVFAHAAAPRGKPDFGLGETMIRGRKVKVHEGPATVDRRAHVGALRDFASRYG
jgi:poly(3-hydroxybutyrate) depolymerase